MDNYCTPLAAILRKAQGCIDPDTGDIVDVGGEVTQLRKICDTLRAELAERKKDAERYREVRKRIVEGTMPEIPIYEELTESKIDAVIDAALAEGEK